ncbi:MAG: hypothetical protein COC06_01585 [Bacteroidales bacterium]|nr:MAG: hypothetical protein COC06_12650 [Bacteroidales bacterium]PCH71353.1 MAG: hypothetical protein COC06_01585 [Bacteroidales bacterium]
MSSIVYLMCSLPSLTFGQVPPMLLDEFNHDAKSQLSVKKFELLKAINIQGDNTTKGRLKNITSMLSEVQQDLSEIRKSRVQKRQPYLERLPRTVITVNPLEREKQIMQWQWEELDSIESNKIFTLIQVIVYKLKLQILCRIHSFNAESGTQVLASVINPLKNEEDKKW